MNDDQATRLLSVLERLDRRLERLEASTAPEMPSVEVPEAAARLGCSRRHVFELLERGELSGPMVGRRRRISTASLMRLLEGTPTPKATGPAPRSRRRSNRVRAAPIPAAEDLDGAE